MPEQSPERKAYMEEYRKRPEVRARRLERDRTPEAKAKAQERALHRDMEKRDIYMKTYMREHREQRRVYNQVYYNEHCEEIKAKAKTYAKEHPEQVKANNKRIYTSYKDLIFQHYGSKCACCGETERVFLSIDHVNNDGYQRRRQNITNVALYISIIKNGYPDDFQILCHNCNFAKILGPCPHWKNGMPPATFKIPKITMQADDKHATRPYTHTG